MVSPFITGQVLQGAEWRYVIRGAIAGDHTHASTVFKADVLPYKNASAGPRWAIIKAVSYGNKSATGNLRRECQIYSLSSVASALCFRRLYDVINDHTIALEWLETSLAEVEYRPGRDTYNLIKATLRAALDSCVALNCEDYVNTDYKPANILLSSVGTNRVTAKVGDLGLVFPTGERLHVQPAAMRAPEVWLGQTCVETSQVWAIAAMLCCWIKPGILGFWGSPHDLFDDMWSMAKIKRLFPGWDISTSDLSEAVNDMTKMKELEAVSSFEDEMQKVAMPRRLRDLLRIMLVTDPGRRPSASRVLASKEFRALVEEV